MKLKSKYRYFNPFSFFFSFRKKLRVIILLVAFSTILGIAFIAGIYIHKTGTLHRLLPYGYNTFSFGNYYSGLMAEPEKLIIDIKFKNLQKLTHDNQEAIDMGYLNTLDADESYVPIKITYNNKTVDAKARIKGNDIDARKKGKWSLRIRVKGDETIMGMKVFSIHDPGVKNYMTEWIFHQLLRFNDLISLRYKFIEVSINGEDSGIYALEENFEKRLIENNKRREGILLRFDEYWNYYFHFAQRWDTWDQYKYKTYSMEPIDAFETSRIEKDSTLNNQFRKAKNLLEAYRQGDLSVSQAFDVDKIAKIFVITDLLGNHHGLEERNIRFYYNPITSLLEPVGFDQHLQVQQIDKLIGESREIFSGKEKDEMALWENSFFEDTSFYKLYIKHLHEYSQPQYLDSFINNINQGYQESLNILYKENYRFIDKSLDLIKYNQGYIQRILKPISGIEIYYSDLKNDSITIQLGSFHPLPIVINSVTLDGKKIAGTKMDNIILESKVDFKLMQFKTFRIKLNTALPETKVLETLKVNCFILGLDERIPESIRHHNFYDETYLNHDFIRQKPNIHEFDFLSIDEVNKLIQIEPGLHKVLQNLIIPSGFHVLCKPGAILDLLHSSSILSYSPFIFAGTDNSPIHIQSSDSSGQGIVIINAKGSSFFDNVSFENLSNPSKNEWNLTGAITFYESPVKFLNCIFKNNLIGDDLINLVRSKFEIRNCTFSKTKADALDCDFSVGTISDTKFFNIGNDAIDISGSQLTISNIFINKTGDKGLSVGERSLLNGSDIEIINVDKGVASKDLSVATLKSVTIKDSRIGYTAFQKKTEYGPAQIILTESSYSNVRTPFLIEENSTLTKDGKAIIADQEHLKDLLYEVKEN